MLRRNWIAWPASFVLVILLLMGPAGCASYNTRAVSMEQAAPHVSSSGGDLCLYVDEYASESKCKRAFDSDLAEEGVLALLVKIENTGQDPFEIASRDLIVRDSSTTLRRMSAEEAAGKAKRSAVGRAIGWSLVVPIIAIPVAAAVSAHDTHKVNKEIKEDFCARELKDCAVAPHKEETGFLFYEIPAGRKNLQGLELAMTARNTVTQETVSVATPLPNTSFKAPKAKSDSSKDQE